jgi:hypothetical protein
MSFVGRCEAMSATFAANVAVRFLEEASWPGDLEEIHVVCNDEGGDGKSQAFELARFADAAAVMPDASMDIGTSHVSHTIPCIPNPSNPSIV